VGARAGRFVAVWRWTIFSGAGAGAMAIANREGAWASSSKLVLPLVAALDSGDDSSTADLIMGTMCLEMISLSSTQSGPLVARSIFFPCMLPMVVRPLSPVCFSLGNAPSRLYFVPTSPSVFSLIDKDFSTAKHFDLARGRNAFFAYLANY
jgi:hypothetical protein